MNETENEDVGSGSAAVFVYEIDVLHYKIFHFGQVTTATEIVLRAVESYDSDR